MRRTVALLLVPLFLLGTSCSDDDTSGSGAASITTTSVDDATSTTAAVTSTTLTPFPAENRDLSHGGDTWAVVLVAVELPAGNVEDDPVLQAAKETANEPGYSTGPTDCDAGASKAMGYDAKVGVFTVSVYLKSEADAEQALRAFHERGFDGGVVALVQTYCMD
jgi:hypothetical protein